MQAPEMVEMGSWTREYPENKIRIDDDLRSILEIEPWELDLIAAISSRIHPDDLQEVCQTLPNAIAKNLE